MPFGAKPSCIICQTTESELWRKTESKKSICNGCFLEKETSITIKTENDNDGSDVEMEIRSRASAKKHYSQQSPSKLSGGSQFIGSIRKSSRLKPSKYKNQAQNKTLATKGKNRRVLSRKNPIKSVPSVATNTTSDYVFHDGCYMQIGDIVSVMDEEDSGIYFAQIRGFLQDQYCDKSAVITWLVPTVNSPNDKFDPTTYILGPEEDLPRSLDYFQFVCHAPSEYYRAKNAPYPTRDPMRPELGYISTALGAEISTIPTNDELYSLEARKQFDRIPKAKTVKPRRGRRLRRPHHSTSKDR